MNKGFDDWAEKDKQIDKHYDMIEDWEVYGHLGLEIMKEETFFTVKDEMAYDRAREEYEEGGYKG